MEMYVGRGRNVGTSRACFEAQNGRKKDITNIVPRNSGMHAWPGHRLLSCLGYDMSFGAEAAKILMCLAVVIPGRGFGRMYLLGTSLFHLTLPFSTCT